MRVTATGRARSFGSGYATYEYQKEFQIVNDSPRLRLKRGDVVQVSNYCVSQYARGQFGVVIDRYRWVKFKWETYIDYGTTIMFLTGKKKGKTKKFYACAQSQLSKQIY